MFGTFKSDIPQYWGFSSWTGVLEKLGGRGDVNGFLFWELDRKARFLKWLKHSQ